MENLDDVFKKTILPSRRQDRNAKCCGYLIVLLVTLSLFLSIVTFVKYLEKATIDRSSSESSNDIPQCVSCSYLSAAIDGKSENKMLFESLEQKPGKGAESLQCCAETADQRIALTKLVFWILSEKSSPKTMTQLLGMRNSSYDGRAFAQKSLYVIKRKPSPNSHLLITDNDTCLMRLNPEKDNPQYELKHGVDLIDTGIRIRHPGLYFVYKSVNFFPDPNEPCEKFPIKTFKSILVRKRVDQETKLVTSMHTCCHDCTHESKTGFTGGVFSLERGDIIQVNVTSSAIIQVGTDVTFLGLMMMGGQSM